MFLDYDSPGGSTHSQILFEILYSCGNLVKATAHSLLTKPDARDRHCTFQNGYHCGQGESGESHAGGIQILHKHST